MGTGEDLVFLDALWLFLSSTLKHVKTSGYQVPQILESCEASCVPNSGWVGLESPRHGS